MLEIDFMDYMTDVAFKPTDIDKFVFRLRLDIYHKFVSETKGYSLAYSYKGIRFVIEQCPCDKFKQLGWCFHE